MGRRTRHMKILAFWMVLFIPVLGLVAQQNVPYELREYIDPDQLVTLSPGTDFQEAIQILNSFAKEYEDKVIINRTGRSGPIGINVPTMYWRQALEYITSAKDLLVSETAEYYEILPRDVTGEGEKARKSQAPAVNLETREIKISATFFEGNRRLLRELGVDWSVIDNGKVNVTSLGAQNVSQNEVFSVEVNWTEIIETGWDIKNLFSTFEASNEGEILSSPTIKVMEGEEGRIQVGQDFSIKQRDIAGNVTDEFFSVGTILEVVPFIIRKGDTTFIHLEINAEKSSAQPDPVSTIINKQESKTQVLLLDGEETVMAGLYSTEESVVRRGIPFLKDLPPWFFGIRYLFGYDQRDIQKRELVIFIKAELIPTLEERMDAEVESAKSSLDRSRNSYKSLEDFKR